MKIGIVFSSYEFLKNLKYELVQSLIKENHELVIIIPKNIKNSYFNSLNCKFIEIDLVRRSKNPFLDFRYYKTLKRIFKNEKFDKIITYTVKPNIYGGMAAKKLKVPYYTNITGLGSAFQKSLLKLLVVRLYRFSLKKSKMIFFENQDNLNTFIKNKISTTKNSYCIFGAGVNLNNYSYQPIKKEDTLKILYIGRVMKEKGIDELLYCIEQSFEQNLNVSFSIIGFFEENYKEKIENLVSKGILNYYGFVDNVKDYIKDSSCIILPSYHEGMNNGLLEGASSGRVLLSSNIHGCKEIVLNNKTGFTFEVKNKEDMLNKIIKLSKLTNDELNQIGYNARKHIEENFDRELINKKFVEIINSIN